MSCGLATDLGAGRAWMLVQSQNTTVGNDRCPVAVKVFEVLIFMNHTEKPVAAFVEAAKVES